MHATRALASLLLVLAGCSAAEELAPVPADGAATVACPELADIDPWLDRLGGRTLADRGEILACAHMGSFPAAVAANTAPFPPAAPEATFGYELFVIQYVSEGRPGEARAVSALVYAPSGGALELPIVALGHGTLGMGPSCGPSHVPALTDPSAVPLVGRGYAVVAPDYQGGGVDNGMSSYLVGAAEAAATLDGVRALQRIHDPRFDAAQLGKDLFTAGHSQGGHAALFAHQHFDESVGARLLGSVALAPGLGSAREWAQHFTGATRPVGGLESLALASLYARMMHAGAPPLATWLTPAAQKEAPELLRGCLSELITSIPARFPTLGDLYQPSFLAAAQGCSFEGACPEFEPWASGFLADRPGGFSSAAPSLILQGLADPVVPATAVACTRDRLIAAGTPVTACGYPGVDHTAIVAVSAAEVIRWMSARRAGEMPDVCPAPLTVPCDGP